MRLFLILLAVVGAIGASAFFWWINSPLFAFQEAALAIKNHDAATFKKYVAADEIIDHFIDDLMVEPAMSTPNLSQFQSGVAGGALAMAKAQMTKALLQSIDNYLATLPPADDICYLQFFGCAPARAQSQNTAGGGLKELMHVARQEMSGEVNKLKTVAYNRMISFIQNHPQSVPGKLLDCPPQERSAHTLAMLQEYGFSLNNFKGLAGCATNSDIVGRQTAQAGFNFFSPKINNQITLQIELRKDMDTGVWRIDRLLNVKEIMDQEEPLYDRDIHELVDYSLSGMSDKNMARDMKGMTDRLKQSAVGQDIWRRLNLR